MSRRKEQREGEYAPFLPEKGLLDQVRGNLQRAIHRTAPSSGQIDQKDLPWVPGKNRRVSEYWMKGWEDGYIPPTITRPEGWPYVDHRTVSDKDILREDRGVPPKNNGRELSENTNDLAPLHQAIYVAVQKRITENKERGVLPEKSGSRGMIETNFERITYDISPFLFWSEEQPVSLLKRFEEISFDVRFRHTKDTAYMTDGVSSISFHFSSSPNDKAKESIEEVTDHHAVLAFLLDESKALREGTKGVNNEEIIISVEKAERASKIPISCLVKLGARTVDEVNILANLQTNTFQMQDEEKQKKINDLGTPQSLFAGVLDMILAE